MSTRTKGQAFEKLTLNANIKEESMTWTQAIIIGIPIAVVALVVGKIILGLS